MDIGKLFWYLFLSALWASALHFVTQYATGFSQALLAAVVV